MKKLLAVFLICATCWFPVRAAYATGNIVKIVSVQRATWTVHTGRKETGAGGKAIGAGAGMWLLGPVGLAAGLYLGHNADNNSAVEETATVQGYQIKLNTGERLRTLVPYKVGQRINRDDIEAEL